MNRDQKAAAVAEIAEQIQGSEAVFAIDYRGITVAQVAELRTRLRESDSTFRVVKNTLTERAADQADAEVLKALLEGPTALTFVRGDAAAAAKAIADYQRSTGGELLPFKGGLMNGEALDAAQITAISKLPSRQVLYGQLVGMVASPITGLARSLNGLVSGLAIALSGVLEKKESGEVPSGDAPAAPAAEAPAAEAPAAEAPAASDQAPEAPVAEAAPEEPTEGAADTTTETQED
ncbi:MAG TPA: 50S ribosomal protein L10 [Baekduia sp.]|uniref:50S ribosomal protein L10 n=1 Tax=Baekduia sp. TaxID=2600305 RepID=UPI002C4892CB|nr:50S ribosomal protein L10 [Baekduia sp.]HMJ34876.1 50S ribosomal protein L10 [Baekduia sp.]